MTTLSNRSGRTPPRRFSAKRRPKTGFNQSRSSHVIAIKLCTGLNVESLANKYYVLVDKWVSTRGIHDTTRRLKSIYVLALNSMVGSPSVPDKYWISTNERGFPSSVAFLEGWYLKGGDDKTARMQAVLSILNWYRGMIAPGIPDLTSITQGPIIDTPEELFVKIVEGGINPSWKIDKEILSTVKMPLRFKQGPNGQATRMAIADLSSMTDILFESVTGLLSLSGFEGRQIAQTMKTFKSKVPENSKYRHSKLSIKREGGGKDRVFAMVDYWTQTSLKPYHDSLCDILRAIPQDCTFDQSKGVEDMLKWSLDKDNSSIDLSSASDRFPIKLQLVLLGKLFDNDEMVRHWRTTMIDRDFAYKSKSYRWSVGQPLGSYSSWPSFALAHHTLVRYAHSLTGHPLEYYILGDDLVIRHLPTATVYRDLLYRLGIEVSESKSLTGGTIEFAKRLFHSGKEVSPIPVPMIHATIRDKGLLSECVLRLIERSSTSVSNLRVSEFSKEWSKINGTNLENAIVLCEFAKIRLTPNFGVPRDDRLEKGEPSYSWGSVQLPLKVIEWVHTSVKFRYLLNQYASLWSKLGNIPRMLQNVELPGTPTSLRRLHPIYLANEEVREDISRATRECRDYLEAPLGSPVPLPNASVISLTGMVTGSKKLSKHNTKVIELTYIVCQAIYSKTIGPQSERVSLEDVLSGDLIDDALNIHPDHRF